MSDDVKPYTREELDELDAAHRRKDGSLRGPGSYGMLSADEFERLLATAKQGVEALDAIHRTAVSLRWWVQYGCDDEEMANVAGQLETFAARAVSSSASETTKESPAAAVERGVRETTDTERLDALEEHGRDWMLPELGNHGFWYVFGVDALDSNERAETLREAADRIIRQRSGQRLHSNSQGEQK